MGTQTNTPETRLTTLALVVEDNEGTRRSFSDLLRASGVTPVVAGDLKSAIREVKGSPGFHLILADINLDPTNPRDKSGIVLARHIRHLDKSIPIVGYSSAVAEGQLSQEELAMFTDYYGKGAGSGAAQKTQRIEGWKTLAENYRATREQRAREQLRDLRERYPASQSEFSTLRFLIPTKSGSVEGGMTEELLRAAGYRIRIVERGALRPLIDETSARIAAPIMFWLRDDADAMVAEVYGYPELYSYGENEEDAIQSVLLLMDGFFQDFRDEKQLSESYSTKRLRDFIDSVFGGRDAVND